MHSYKQSGKKDKAKINEIASFNKEMKQNIEDINKKYQVCNSEFNTKHESLSKEINDTKSLIEEKNKTMSEFVSSMIDTMKNELNNAQENKYQPIEKTITEHKQLLDTISKDNSNFNEEADCFIALICADEPTRETENPTSMAGLCPELNNASEVKI